MSSLAVPTRKEAKIVTGNLNDWITSARASTPGTCHAFAMLAMHLPTDVMDQADANFAIDVILRRHGGMLGMIDLTDGQEFSWGRFLMGRQWGMEILDFGVRSFHVGRDLNGYVYLEN